MIINEPFVYVFPEDSDISLRNRCQEKVKLLLDNVPNTLRHSQDLPSTLVNEPEFEQIVYNRKWEMLQTLHRILSSGEIKTSRLNELHRLVWAPDRATVSTPVLLAIGFIIYSHYKWTENHFHNLQSAFAAEVFLKQLPSFPNWLIEKLSSLIALTNVYRTCVTHQNEVKEVAVWEENQLSFENEKIAPAIAQLLQKVWTRTADVGIDTLDLIAASYEGRSRNPVNFPVFEDFTGLVKQNLEPIGEKNTYTLVFFQFGRYVFRDLKPKLQKQITKKIVSEKINSSSPPAVLGISLDRHFATRHGKSLAKLLMDKESELSSLFSDYELKNLQLPRAFIDTIDCKFYHLNLEPNNAFKVIFNCHDEAFCDSSYDSFNWSCISQAIDLLLKKRRGREYRLGDPIPWGYTMNMLHELGHMYPNDFFELRVLRTDSDSAKELKKLNTIHLPRAFFDGEDASNNYDLEKAKKELKDVVDKKEWNNPKLLVARALSGLLINQRIGFGTNEQRIEVNPDEELEKLRDFWLKLADWVDEKNHHDALKNYLKVYSSEKFQRFPQVSFSKSALGKLEIIAGFDIGGTRIKAALYEYYPDQDTLGKTITEAEIPTKLPNEEKHDNINSFVEYLNQQLTEDKDWQDGWKNWSKEEKDWQDGWKNWSKEEKDWKEKLAAIGVTWPGAVKGSLGHEYIASFSRSLGYFNWPKDQKPDKQKEQKEFHEVSSEEIHQMDLRAAFQKQFGESIPVTLMNDGVAHVIYHQWQFNRELLNAGDTVVGLFMGTGSAMAVINGETGLPLRILAEVGRMITDIGAPFIPPKPNPNDNFPRGLGNEIFNRKTLSNIAKKLFKEWTGYDFEYKLISLSAGETFPEEGNRQIFIAKNNQNKLHLLISDVQGRRTNIDLEEAAKNQYKGENKENKELNELQEHLRSSDSKESQTEADQEEKIRKAITSITGEIPPLPGLLISLILEEIEIDEEKEGSQTKAESEAIAKIKKLWEKEKNPNQPNLEDCKIELQVDFGLKDTTIKCFAQEVAKRAGESLADIIVQTRELYGSRNFFAGGGPMSGATGRAIREEARLELRETYALDIPLEFQSQAQPKLHQGNIMRFPESQIAIKPPGPSGARGAAQVAEATLSSKSNSNSQANGFNGPSFSTFSAIVLGNQVSGEVLFPALTKVQKSPDDEKSKILFDIIQNKLDIIQNKTLTLGYVRSCLRASKSLRVSLGQQENESLKSKLEECKIKFEKDKPNLKSPHDPRPWRDYPESFLTQTKDVIDLVKQNRKDHHLIISARNTINEAGYQVRFQGKWYRRRGDEATVKDEWPVIVCKEKSLNLRPFKEVKDDNQIDLVTGIPLVINGESVTRSFLIGNCSDLSHVYEVNPYGRLSSSAKAWIELSEAWQRAKDQGLDDYAITQRLDNLAYLHGVTQSCNLLHSLLTERQDGTLVYFAITGSLVNIAKELAKRWQIRHAVLLDNGGSVGTYVLSKNYEDANLMISGPNHRPKGLVFLNLWVKEFVHPQQHPLLNQQGGQ